MTCFLSSVLLFCSSLYHPSPTLFTLITVDDLTPLTGFYHLKRQFFLATVTAALAFGGNEWLIRTWSAPVRHVKCPLITLLWYSVIQIKLISFILNLFWPLSFLRFLSRYLINIPDQVQHYKTKLCLHKHNIIARHKRRGDSGSWDGYHCFQQVVLLIKAVSCCVSAQPPTKRKPSLSPTQHWIEKCSVATHTSLPGGIPVPNIWALSLLKACELLSPWLICSRGRGWFNRKRPPYRVRLRSLSMGAVSAGAKGISIESAAQTAHKERKGGKHSKDFLFRSGIRVLEG